jgi:hypothetical protein
VWTIRYNEQPYENYNDIQLPTYIQLKRFKQADHIIRTEDYRTMQEDHVLGGKLCSSEGCSLTAPYIETGGWWRKIDSTGGTKLGKP